MIKDDDARAIFEGFTSSTPPEGQAVTPEMLQAAINQQDDLILKAAFRRSAVILFPEFQFT